VEDENGDLLAHSHNILNRWKNYFSQLLNVHKVTDVRQTEINTAKCLVPSPCHLEVETAIAELKKHKSQDSDQWQMSVIVVIHKKGDKTDRNNYDGISLLSTSYKILLKILFSM
jgi:hypothetical protein